MIKIKLNLNQDQVSILAQILPTVRDSRIGHCEKFTLMEWHEKHAGKLEYHSMGFKATLLPSQAYALAVFLGSLDDLSDQMFQIEASEIINNLGKQLPKSIFVR